ncbi:MAG TPA: RNA methyltransferase [Chitinophagales bacterium]|nr:RNA methyltransferase [Chitinophagales bacterium]
MLSKHQIKFLNALKQKKFREEYQLFIAEGNKIIPELLDSVIKVKQVYVLESAVEKLKKKNDVEYITIKQGELERISFLTTPNEMVAVCEIPQPQLVVPDLKNKLTLVLDTIKDPGNLGTIIRVADWFGIQTIVCSSQTADVYNPKVVQATMGSVARVQIHYSDLYSFLSSARQDLNLPVYGALLEGENIYSHQLPQAAVIVIGNESRGISPELMTLLTHKVKIPSFAHFRAVQGDTESLNAAIATAIICSEFRRT